MLPAMAAKMAASRLTRGRDSGPRPGGNAKWYFAILMVVLVVVGGVIYFAYSAACGVPLLGDVLGCRDTFTTEVKINAKKPIQTSLDWKKVDTRGGRATYSIDVNRRGRIQAHVFGGTVGVPGFIYKNDGVLHTTSIVWRSIDQLKVNLRPRKNVAAKTITVSMPTPYPRCINIAKVKQCDDIKFDTINGTKLDHHRGFLNTFYGFLSGDINPAPMYKEAQSKIMDAALHGKDSSGKPSSLNVAAAKAAIGGGLARQLLQLNPGYEKVVIRWSDGISTTVPPPSAAAANQGV